eukprot:Pgem_evm1s3201
MLSADTAKFSTTTTTKECSNGADLLKNNGIVSYSSENNHNKENIISPFSRTNSTCDSDSDFNANNEHCLSFILKCFGERKNNKVENMHVNKPGIGSSENNNSKKNNNDSNHNYNHSNYSNYSNHNNHNHHHHHKNHCNNSNNDSNDNNNYKFNRNNRNTDSHCSNHKIVEKKITKNKFRKKCLKNDFTTHVLDSDRNSIYVYNSIEFNSKSVHLDEKKTNLLSEKNSNHPTLRSYSDCFAKEKATQDVQVSQKLITVNTILQQPCEQQDFHSSHHSSHTHSQLVSASFPETIQNSSREYLTQYQFQKLQKLKKQEQEQQEQQQMLLLNYLDINRTYTFRKTLNVSQTAKVELVTHNYSGKKFILKRLFAKTPRLEKAVCNEIDLLQS